MGRKPACLRGRDQKRLRTNLPRRMMTQELYQVAQMASDLAQTIERASADMNRLKEKLDTAQSILDAEVESLKPHVCL